jgi:restriction endonuclease S subunit
MTELEQLLTHSLTALVEQSEQQTALINALDARLQKLEQQLAHTAGQPDRQAWPRTTGWPTTRT